MNTLEPDRIPFLPISMFRDHVVQTGEWSPQAVFQSSGTTQSFRSRHYIRDLDGYHKNAIRAFKNIFGDPADYNWLALMPSYLDNPDSSLISMVNAFMKQAPGKENKFFPEVNDNIVEKIEAIGKRNEKTVLFGVSFALLDLFEKYNIVGFENLLVIETGGMKGRSVEITREELHSRIKASHPSLVLSSEYGMTELLSQAYLVNGHFQPSTTMQVMMRDLSDPLSYAPVGRRGCINVIDLANIDTCSFIATDDIGIVYPDGNFDVLGRLDQADIRGCNLLYA